LPLSPSLSLRPISFPMRNCAWVLAARAHIKTSAHPSTLAVTS
jgi:hypothetical protein